MTASSMAVCVPLIRLDWFASLVMCISMQISTSGTIREKAFNSPRDRVAYSNRALIRASSHVHSWLTGTGEKL